MEDQDKQVQGNAEVEDQQVEEPKDETQSEEPKESEAGDQQQVEEAKQPEESEERKPSRRENLRIQTLIERLRAKEQPTVQPQGLDYRSAIDTDDETRSVLEADRRAAAQAAYTQGMSQAQSIQFHTRLELDAPKIESKYPQFDKASSEFNPVVANAVNQWFLATAGYEPSTNTVKNADVRYADFVEGIMELAGEMAGARTAKTTQNIAKQAAQTGLRPDGSSAKSLNLNQDPSAMTDEELTAAIAASMPRR